MTITSMLFASTLLVVMVAGVGAQPPATAQPPAGNAENGKRLYVKQTCYFCHGTAGQGGIAGARVAAVGRNAQSFVRYVRRPSGQMPAFTEKILSDQELADIFAYVRSLPSAKPAKDIPLLDQLKD
jgi:mono/diheme cytochrome c family protein